MTIPAWTDEDVRGALVPQNEFPTCSYRRGTRLGRGSYANVYKVLNVRTGGLFAGKVSPEHVGHLRKEASILRKLNHSKVVKYIEYFEENNHPASNVLVMELCAGGSLQDKVNDNPAGLKREDILQVLLQIGQALDYFHSKGLFHGDIKPRNILIRTWSPVDVVVGDCAEVMKVNNINVHKRPHGTMSFWSPNIWRHWKHAGKSDDIWALGISLLAMMGQLPHLFVKEHRQYPRKCASHARNLYEINPGHDLVQILLRLLEWDHNKRIIASEMVNQATERLEAHTNLPGNLKSPEGFQPLQFW
ncbi:serine threonine kinase [Fusarium beomiforme]|uniref:non-specific serine/threonine protein kinase n=1 Tax=Fusarium beomiforme TaxID=44412 RepID=A0A9P5DT86_9HYPO|nr:serine threonine kinase [Fusarium beomiforme]